MFVKIIQKQKLKFTFLIIWQLCLLADRLLLLDMLACKTFLSLYNVYLLQILRVACHTRLRWRHMCLQ